ncbi:MAG: SAM-dependent methyltransferase [Solirubrobacteraceae bacterium]
MHAVHSAAQARDRLAELSAGAWLYTAVGVAVEAGMLPLLSEPRDPSQLAAATGLPEALAGALADALVATGLARRSGAGVVAEPGLAELAGPGAAPVVRADLRTGPLQMAALFDAPTRGEATTGWAHADERILQAQGTMSAGAADLLEHQILPRVDGMLDRLASDEGAFLDVGAGVAAVTIELCRRYPRLRAVALEPAPAPRAIAERNVAAAGLADRIEVRDGLVQDLGEAEAFDLVWLPGNFLGPALLPAALAAVFAALRRGGYVLNAALGGGADDPRSAAARLRAVLWGGGVVAPERVAELLAEAGFADVVLMGRLAGGLVPMQARRPA